MADIIDLIASDSPVIQFIKAIVGTPASARSILSQARAAGHSIANSTGLQVINYLRANPLTPLQYIQSLANDKLPNLQNIKPSLTNMLSNFYYEVLFTGTDATTGEPSKQYIGIRSNSLLTKQQAIDFAVNIMEDNPAGYSIIEYEPEVTDIKSNKDGITNPFNDQEGEIPF